MRIKISVNYNNVISSLKGELPIELNELIKKSFRENKFHELEQLLKKILSKIVLIMKYLSLLNLYIFMRFQLWTLKLIARLK